MSSLNKSSNCINTMLQNNQQFYLNLLSEDKCALYKNTEFSIIPNETKTKLNVSKIIKPDLTLDCGEQFVNKWFTFILSMECLCKFDNWVRDRCINAACSFIHLKTKFNSGTKN